MNRKKTQRSPERTLKLYDWLWCRANDGKTPAFCNLSPQTLTGHCILLIIPQMLLIQDVLKSPAYRKSCLGNYSLKLKGEHTNASI